METRELGRGGPRVSVVGMGTWQTLDVAQGRDVVVGTALDAGSTFVDSFADQRERVARLAHMP